MTKNEALKQSQKWWGDCAYVENRGQKASTKHLKQYIVGCIVKVILPMKCVKGQGASWKEAIDNVRDDEKKRRL